MDFPSAVATCFSKYATFSGRARRAEFWWFALFNSAVFVILSVIELTFGDAHRWMMGEGGPGLVGGVYWLAILLPSLAVTVRRLHDTDRSGWWLLLEFVPVIGPLVLIWFLATPGTAGPNRVGPDPLGPPPGGAAGYGPSSLPKVPRR